ncbi:MAG: hypothetical protein ACTSPP_09850, partial [Candidatus Heimdallarchaeaceae archaeon]
MVFLVLQNKDIRAIEESFWDIVEILGILFSLPVLFYGLGSKINSNLGIILGALAAFVILIIYLVSVSKAIEAVYAVKDSLEPVLGIAFVAG